MRLIASLVAALSLSVVSSACGKKAEPTPPTTPATTAAPAADAGTAPEADAAPAPAADAAPAAEDTAAPAAEDAAPTAAEEVAAEEIKPYIKVTVAHDHDKPPITAEFTTWSVVEAHIDLTKPETAKAVIEIDLASFASGVDDRDKHVKSPDFLDIAQFTKATVTVSGVKAQATADSYDATATLDLHGVKKDLPVTFKVVEKKADGSIVIEGEAKGIARADFGMTKAPAEVNVGPTFDVSLRLELAEVAPLSPEVTALLEKMIKMQTEVFDLIDANKADPEKAAVAIEKYTADHKDDIKSLLEAQSKIAPADMERAFNGAQEKFKALAERGAKLLTDNPGLRDNEHMKKAMAALSSGGQ